MGFFMPIPTRLNRTRRALIFSYLYGKSIVTNPLTGRIKRVGKFLMLPLQVPVN